MIARLLNNGSIVRIDTPNEDRFLEVNPTGGFFKINEFPYSEFGKLKIVEGVVVVDIEAEIILKEAEQVAEAKALQVATLEALTVTTSLGNTFDANNQARLDMSNVITASEFLAITETIWRMADDSEVLIQLAELKQALTLAIQEYARVKSIGV